MALRFHIGQRFNRLTVVSRAQERIGDCVAWICKCDCGGEITARGTTLASGRTKSCGCLKRELEASCHKIHGLCGSPRYRMFCQAKTRAKRLGISFQIRLNDVPEVPEYCPVLGLKLSPSPRGSARASSPSLDKIIPSLGYVPGNVRVISNRANRLKNDCTPEEIVKIAWDALVHLGESERRIA